jgi:hypothetical protein
MPQSTPLDQLAAPETTAADEERVKRILAEMNADSMIQMPPPVGSSPPAIISEPPITTSTGQIRMDPTAARAHVIGKSTPTLADFQAMFQAAPPGMAPYHGSMATPQTAPTQPVPVKPQGWRELVFDQLRLPIAVAGIVFLLNLPVITTILSRYASWMYLNSGEISIAGLFMKALLAALLFAIYQGISAIFDGAK